MKGEDFKNFAIGGAVLAGLGIVAFALFKASGDFGPPPSEGEPVSSNPISRSLDAFLFGVNEDGSPKNRLGKFLAGG